MNLHILFKFSKIHIAEETCFHAVVLEITGHLDLSGDISVRVTNTLTELRERAEDFYCI